MTGAPVGGVAVIRIPVSLLHRDDAAWPRDGLAADRVRDFLQLYLDGGLAAVPPIEVVPDARGGYLVADGNHRLEAILQTDTDEIEVSVLPISAGEDARIVAFERGLVTSSRSSLPLRRSEKHAAILHLKETRPDLSNHQIADLVGCSHQTVGRVLDRSKGPRTATESDAGGSAEQVALVTASEIAAQLFRGIQKVVEMRGFGIWDALTHDHTSERLAFVLQEAFGDDALDRTTQFGIWFDGALEILEGWRS